MSSHSQAVGAAMAVASLMIFDSSFQVDVGTEKFNLSKDFAYGSAESTNIAGRSPDFVDEFQGLAHVGKNSYPCKYADVPTDKGPAGIPQHDALVQIKMQRPKSTPIKIVRTLREKQKLGEEGVLLVNGSRTYIFSEGNTGMKIIRMQFKDGAWHIDHVCTSKLPAFEPGSRLIWMA